MSKDKYQQPVCKVEWGTAGTAGRGDKGTGLETRTRCSMYMEPLPQMTVNCMICKFTNRLEFKTSVTRF